MATLKWNGDEILKRIRVAAADSINATMANAAQYGQRNHPGWRTITGRAQSSIDIVQFAESPSLFGLWGSRGVSYMIWLELNHGSAMRRANDIWGARLKEEVIRRVKLALR